MNNICLDHNIGNFKACVIQAPVTICIGWLLGINQNIDLNVFASALNFLEFIVELNTTVEVDVWPVKNPRVMPNWKDEQAWPKAIHIWVDEAVFAQVSRRLQKLYNSGQN